MSEETEKQTQRNLDTETERERNSDRDLKTALQDAYNGLKVG